MQTERKTCLSAISGGVDSSVATKLLQEAGYAVECVTLELIEDKALIRAAQNVAHELGCVLTIYDQREAFDTCVMKTFVTSYLEGRTPNPCIDCNKHLKFGKLHEMRAREGFDYLATGHYARIVYNAKTDRFELVRGADTAKDQSYFLYTMTQDELAHTLFPLGSMTKEEVRRIARAQGFSSAQKSESQDICFIPHGSYITFIENYLAYEAESDKAETLGKSSCKAPCTSSLDAKGDFSLLEAGSIEDTCGTVLGTHTGLAHYTIGQRKGIGVAAKEPLYVIGKDVSRNVLIVGVKDELSVKQVSAHDVNFVSIDDASCADHMPVFVKTSYRQTPVPGHASFDGTRVHVALDRSIVRPSSGQALVLYDAATCEKVLAGGTIAEPTPEGMS